MNAIVQANLVDTAAKAAPAEAHQQAKAEDAKRVSATELMHKAGALSPAQMMHAMVQVNAGAPSEASGAQRTAQSAPKPTTDMKQMQASAQKLAQPSAKPKAEAAPPKDHEAMTQDALAALRNIPPNPEARRVHSNHSAVGTPGMGASTSAEQSGNVEQVTQVVGNFSLSALAGNQGADRHEDED